MTLRFPLAGLALILSLPAMAQVPIIQPGPPGQPSRQISAEEASDLAGLKFSAADVRFMLGMISHHRQAMEMSALVDSRSNREAVEALARRISLSQEDEIDMMAGWLEDRDIEPPAAAAHHDADFDLMPGMLGSGGNGAARSRRRISNSIRCSCNFMIDHHEGALVMVENLLDQPGSAQDSELYRFTTDVNFRPNQRDRAHDYHAVRLLARPACGADSRIPGRRRSRAEHGAWSRHCRSRKAFSILPTPAVCPIARAADEETLAPDPDAQDDAEPEEPVSGSGQPARTCRKRR